MQNCRDLVARNVALINQGIELLEKVDEDVYSRPSPSLWSCGVGAHFRHCIDFYDCFLRGEGRDRIDYNDRRRDQAFETDPRAARAEMLRVATLLARFARPGEHGLTVNTDGGGSNDSSLSSVARELQFLISHTVHHYALIAVALRLHGLDPGATFGVATSTLDHWNEEADCAR